MRYINPRAHLVTNRTLMTARVVIAKYVCIGSCSRVVVSTSNITISPSPRKTVKHCFICTKERRRCILRGCRSVISCDGARGRRWRRSCISTQCRRSVAGARRVVMSTTLVWLANSCAHARSPSQWTDITGSCLAAPHAHTDRSCSYRVNARMSSGTATAATKLVRRSVSCWNSIMIFYNTAYRTNRGKPLCQNQLDPFIHFDWTLACDRHKAVMTQWCVLDASCSESGFYTSATWQRSSFLLLLFLFCFYLFLLEITVRVRATRLLFTFGSCYATWTYFCGLLASLRWPVRRGRGDIGERCQP